MLASRVPPAGVGAARLRYTPGALPGGPPSIPPYASLRSLTRVLAAGPTAPAEDIPA
jgi:hypothetical protein